MKIPVFHDDQHGTAIVAAAAVLNALKIVGKDIGKVKLVCSGAGAAAIACLDLQVSLGLDRNNIFVLDSKGVVHKGRAESMDADKARYAQETQRANAGRCHRGGRHLPGPFDRRRADAGHGEADGRPADHPGDGEPGAGDPAGSRESRAARLPDRHRPLRLSQPGEQLAVLPVHLPRRARLRRQHDQRGDEARRHAALAAIAQAEPSEIVALAYGERRPPFGPDYLIPRAFDPRLIINIAPAVAKAAMDSGVATRPIEDFDEYRDRLARFVYAVGRADGAGFRGRAAGAEARRLRGRRGRARAARRAGRRSTKGIARPVLVGRTDIIASRGSRSSACA